MGMDWNRPLQALTPTLDGDVLAVLARADAELTGRQAHRLLGHSSEQGVRKTLDRLVEQGVVSSRRAGQAKLYQLNRRHLAAPYIEGLAGLRRELVDRLRETVDGWNVKPAAVLLFGSAARGTAGPSSDIDLLVVRSQSRDPEDPAWRAQLEQLQSDATSWTGNDARVLELGEDELDPREQVIRDALTDGIEIAGSRRRLRRLRDEGSR
jgi:UTP:GlnB (protein PII) uridylyltransferase